MLLICIHLGEEMKWKTPSRSIPHESNEPDIFSTNHDVPIIAPAWLETLTYNVHSPLLSYFFRI